MAVSQSQRLRRAAEKASRRKAIVAEKRKAELAMAGTRQIVDAARAPVETCAVTEGLFETGMGTVVLARKLPSGLVGASFFLVDVWCLGIKNAFFSVMTSQEFEDQMDMADQGEYPMVDADPSYVRKLLHDAAAYADQFGLTPHEDFAAVERIFGDIPLGAETFTFGKDGKPFFVAGPNDSLTRMRRILDILGKRAGADGFDYMLGIDG
ncbi:hypothetical protein SAMN05519103_07909 [Rhizobiales bacterium GAS113]|jgi:hypothetical protein|nr:hypothetical protein SAMN05519103_07909 [Rhizobiales bacterium GAS113]SED13834.1 hypothetical protein SAMN05519104_2878 [Rhizobiales bacterium GAS188]